VYFPVSPSWADDEDWEEVQPPVIDQNEAWDKQFELVHEIRKELEGWDEAVITNGEELANKPWEHNQDLKGQDDAFMYYQFELNKLRSM